jgi:hypothetical protein
MALIIPKNNADAQTLDETLKIYYEANDWVLNSVLIDKLSSALDDLGIENEKKEPQSYTKKTQVLAYFGFITWQDVSNSQSPRKITELGKRFYEARLEKDADKTIEVLIESLSICTFGRNVIGCDSDSDIEAPNVFIKASLLLKGLSNNEFAYILGRMELHGEEFHDAVLKIKVNRIKNIKTYPEENAKKWNDPKPITALKNWGFFNSDDNTISDNVFLKYADQLLALRTKNTEAVRFKSAIGPIPENDDENSTYLPYLTAIRTKPFLLLAGISGTGKSRIVRELAFKSCPKYLQDKDGTMPGNYCMIEVKPNWHDSTELLGYYSNLSKSYQFKKFVKFLVKAKLNPDVPFFVCMDEMNLAPVEHYFAEILSIIETRKHPKNKDTGKVDMSLIKTGAIVESKYFKEATKIDDNGNERHKFNMSDKDWYEYFFDTATMSEDEKKQIEHFQYSRMLQEEGLTLPDNVIIIGTVNMDDTTHQFSRKVIDRAMTIEMNGGKLSEMYGGSRNLEYLSEEEQQKWQKEFCQRYVTADEVLETYKDEAEDIMKKVPARLEEINKALKGTPFEVSYRVLNELTIMIGVMLDDPEEGSDIDSIINKAVDRILLMKILPRIEGDSDMFNLKNAVTVEAKTCHNRLEWLKELAPAIVDENDEHYPQTARGKIQEMIERLENQEFTRFWP